MSLSFLSFRNSLAGLLAMGMLCATPARAYGQTPVLAWSFDETSGDTVTEQMHHGTSKLFGVYRHVPGVAGEALRLDGQSSGLQVAGAGLPQLQSGFAVEAWIVINVYPWNWAPIVDQRRGESAGFLFGVDSFGHLGLQAATDGGWEFATDQAQLPLKQWIHVAASYSAANGMQLFVNGKLVRSRAVQGDFIPANGEDVLIGRVRDAMLPTQWLHPKFPVLYSFDGILDEIKIFDQPLTAQQVQQQFASLHAPQGDVLPYPKLPTGPPDAGPFGGYYATLKYDEMWDAPRRIGPDSDVVVRFDDSPIRVVMWQGANYIPSWITENGIWYSDEFVETGGLPGCVGGEDCEPMSDKQDRYAHVRILENTPARTVIHFRYGQCEAENYVCANPDPATGWTDWADDYYIIYPDGVAARKTVAWTTNFSTWHEFQETMILNQAGQRPEDNIQTKALTFVNMKGETFTYSWEKPPVIIDQPAKANIQMVNLKSEWKPFQIVMPKHPAISTYVGEKTFSMFEWWNHWPVSQVKSSGISAAAPDRPSSTSLSHIEGEPYETTPDSITKIMLDGMTNRPAAELAVLARSWATPATMTLQSAGFTSGGYDPAQRAFVIQREETGGASLHIALQATHDSPLLNPAFVVEGWGEAPPRLVVNGKAVAWGKDARYGLVNTLQRSNLVVWLRMESETGTVIELHAD